MKQKTSYSILFILLIASLCSCNSAKQMTKESRSIRTNLGYIVTTPEYKGTIYCNVVLNSIDGAGLIPLTTFKRKRTIIIPLLLVNYIGEKFQVTLGETSLDTHYRSFLSDALFTECNNSACFNLYEKNNSSNIHSDYSLDIKVIRSETTSQIKLSTMSFLWVDLPILDSNMTSVTDNKIYTADTELEFDVTLSKSNQILHHKVYTTKHKQSGNAYTTDGFGINEICMNNMGEGLSQATKQIVESIATDLSIVIENQIE